MCDVTMTNVNPAELRAVMDRPRSIRHLAVLSPVDKARIDILTALVSKAGILSTLESTQPGLREEEIAMCVEARTSISLYHEIPSDEIPDDAMPLDSVRFPAPCQDAVNRAAVSLVSEF